MQILVVINQHDARQRDLAARITNEAGGHADTVNVTELSDELKAQLRISATPQIVYVPEHLAGERMLEAFGGTLALSAEIAGLYDQEQTALGRPSDRVGQLVEEAVSKGVADAVAELRASGLDAPELSEKGAVI